MKNEQTKKYSSQTILNAIDYLVKMSGYDNHDNILLNVLDFILDYCDVEICDVEAHQCVYLKDLECNEIKCKKEICCKQVLKLSECGAI